MIDLPTLDRLRELGHTEAQLNLILNVRCAEALLSWAVYYNTDGDCIACTGGTVHDRECPVFDSLYKLKTEEAIKMIESAHHAAIREDARRDAE